MPYMNDSIYDSGLTYADTNGTQININFTQEPTTYTEATSTYSCGSKLAINTGAPEPGDIDGRKVVVPDITDGNVDATQTADWWSLTNGVAILVAAGDLSAPQAVTSGNTFTLDAINLTIRDAT